ncbi:MAG: CopG family transcriptional regulator, partial [Armatimonadota bacterium]|nr:CopG family transcriptional regulator [Armatimonadota bacterium]
MAADKFAAKGAVRSRNDLMVMGLRQMLDQLEQEAIDAEFAAMASDARYQQEAEAINAEFGSA